MCGDLLVVNVRSIVFVDEGKNTCHLGVCGFRGCGAGAQDLADNGFQEPEYAEAQRLINMLKYFESIPKDKVPTNSLLREFLGGSDFEY